MLLAAAICPGPPLLVPELAAGAAPELDALRHACDLAVRAMLACAPSRVVVVGAGATTRRHTPDAVGSLAPFGLDLRLGLGAGPAELPLSLGLGRWLLDRAGWTESAVLQELSPAATSAECADLGAELAAGEPTGLLVVGDGSAYPLQTPVGDDGRGTAYDDRVAAALTAVDAQALLALDPADDAPLWVGGRPAWQTLAGAANASAAPAGAASPAVLAGEVSWRGAPYGVGYLVATWLPK